MLLYTMQNLQGKLTSNREKVMAQTKSAMKRIRQTRKRTLKNKRVKAILKSLIKKTNQAIQSGATETKKLVIAAIQRIDKAVKKGIIHRNTAARKKSRLIKKFNILQKSSA